MLLFGRKPGGSSKRCFFGDLEAFVFNPDDLFAGFFFGFLTFDLLNIFFIVVMGVFENVYWIINYLHRKLGG